MVVAVLHARILRLLQSVGRISVFGDGVLERARSTSLALLGTIAAIGLAIVAFALQLGWPIGTDGPLPNAPREERQAVGSAVAVAAVPSRPPAARRNRGGGASRGQPVKPAVGPAASHRGEGSNLVVSNSEPTAPPGHRHPQNHQDAPQGQPTPAPQAPQAPQTPQGGAGASKPQPSPPPQPAPVPHPGPQPEPQPEPEAESSDVPGNGNAYGKGNGNGPPISPPAVGNPHAGDAGSPPGHSGEAPGHVDD
jgi:hypothetical protein